MASSGNKNAQSRIAQAAPYSTAARAGSRPGVPPKVGPSKSGPIKTAGGGNRPITPPSVEQILNNSPRQANMQPVGSIKPKESDVKDINAAASSHPPDTQSATSASAKNSPAENTNANKSPPTKSATDMQPSQVNQELPPTGSAVQMLKSQWEKLGARPKTYQADIDAQSNKTENEMDDIEITDTEPDEEFRTGELHPQASSTHSEENMNDEGQNARTKINLNVFIAGKNSSIVKELKRNEIKFFTEFQRQFGNAAKTSVNFRLDYIKVHCSSIHQKANILKAQNIGDFAITATIPRSESGDDQTDVPQRKDKIYRGVATGVNPELSEDDIKQFINEACSVQRILRRENQQLVPTTAVIFGFKDSLPAYINIGFIRYKINPYLPKPTRCDHCQRFGHTVKKCWAHTPRCSFCSGSHSYKDCPQKSDPNNAMCANCHGKHSAAFKQCPKFITSAKAIEMNANQGVPIKKALLAIEANNKQQTITTQIDAAAAETEIRAPAKNTPILALVPKPASISKIPKARSTPRPQRKANNTQLANENAQYATVDDLRKLEQRVSVVETDMKEYKVAVAHSSLALNFVLSSMGLTLEEACKRTIAQIHSASSKQPSPQNKNQNKSPK